MLRIRHTLNHIHFLYLVFFVVANLTRCHTCESFIFPLDTRQKITRQSLNDHILPSTRLNLSQEQENLFSTLKNTFQFSAGKEKDIQPTITSVERYFEGMIIKRIHVLGFV